MGVVIHTRLAGGMMMVVEVVVLLVLPLSDGEAAMLLSTYPTQSPIVYCCSSSQAVLTSRRVA